MESTNACTATPLRFARSQRVAPPPPALPHQSPGSPDLRCPRAGSSAPSAAASRSQSFVPPASHSLPLPPASLHLAPPPATAPEAFPPSLPSCRSPVSARSPPTPPNRSAPPPHLARGPRQRSPQDSPPDASR